MKKILHHGSAIAAILATFLAGPHAVSAQDKKPIRVPFELLATQHMIVQVKINGKGPYTMIFDTGAPVTLISSKVAKEADILGKDFKMPLFSLFGTLGEVKVKSLAIGDARAENMDALAMDHPTVGLLARVLKKPIEGLVGFPFFARYRVTLDYQAKEMTFVPSGYEPPNTLEKLTKMLISGGTKKVVLAPGALIGIKVGKEPQDEKAGVSIRAVFPGSPAAAAGLQVGDRLLELDGRWTDSVHDTYEAAASLRADATVPIVIKRKGKEETRSLKLQAGL